MPGYRKTREEVERIEGFLRSQRFTMDELAINFKTTWEYARWVLPPCFEPIGDEDQNIAHAFVNIAQCESAYAGEGDYCAVSLACKYRDLSGTLMIVELVTGDMWVSMGRDGWGEVKKWGVERFYRDGTRYYGYGERFGLRVVEIQAEISGPELVRAGEPLIVDTHAFDVKMFPHADPGQGLQYPPLLNIWDLHLEYTSIREGTGTLRWGHSKWDPTDTIPLLEVGTARASQYASWWPLGQQIELSDAEDIYKQYMYGRGFDDPTYYRIATRWQGEDVLNPDPDSEAYSPSVASLSIQS